MKPTITFIELDMPFEDGEIAINVNEIQCFYKLKESDYAQIQLKNCDVKVLQTYEQIEELLTNIKY